ncbi:beta-galactosidase [Pelomonas aquatica]|uniref:Beta-galactosidase n=1 Tax=Pelomonas aquatica TaxID=431058 RepID=A0ABU1ZE38_9BURK|nr:sugar-binding domain-containing protein [Pelomonas aquatica]MDR7297936.1 beta-galactosidase [Pelomonas aquatica]
MTPQRIATFLAILTLALSAHAARETYNFNPAWRLHIGDAPGAEARAFDDAAWKPVTLPRAWNEDDAFAKDIVDHRTGIAWYRKHFTLPKDVGQRKVFIEFEGARQAAEVWVNGQRIGLHENGITAFGFDLSRAVKPGDNLIAVRTDNRWDYREQATGQRYQWADRNFNANYGGLPKNLRLHVTDKLYQTLPLFSNLGTTGVYVHASDFDIQAGRATVTAEAQVRNEHDQPRRFGYAVTLRDRGGKVVAAFKAPLQTVAAGATTTVAARAPVKGLQFWSWGHGALYDVQTTLTVDGKPIDTVNTRTGFRQTEFANGMVKLNGRVIQLKGYAQRTSNEWPAIGLSVPPWLSDYGNGQMLASNANFVRWMHTAPWKQDVESLDRIGLMQAMPAGDSEADVTGRRWEQRMEAMRDAIVYFRNNPSIVMYEAGNRGVSAEHMAEVRALRDRFDPHGGRAAGSREMLSRALQGVAEYGGEMLYINKSARRPMWAMEYSRDEGARKFWDELSPPFHQNGDGPPHKGEPAPSYNHNQDSHALENVRRWVDYWRERPGTGTRVSSGGVNIIFSDSNTHHRGAENYRRSGEVDAMRIPKDGFFAHQVMWDGWVDVERPRAHLLGHWNYAAGAVKTITVISSAARVLLTLNGKPLGAVDASEPFVFRFENVRFEPGELRAIGLDKDGRQVCEDVRVTAGAPAALKLTAQTHPQRLQADGADLALVQVEVVDAQGRRNPIALDTVKFTLDGPAEWRGGIAQGPGNFVLARELPVEGGVNRVLVRSTTEAGTIRLRAEAQGLAPAMLELRSQRVEIVGGLSKRFPADGVPPQSARGATPATPAFTVGRIAVPVASAEAASGDAAKAFDDDESTSWTSASGQGAIRFHLAEAATLSELTLKLGGWRERQYPLRISVDGMPVYQGLTPRSLGYVTLPLKAHHVQVVSIELTGDAQGGADAANTEVANQKIVDTGASRLGRGVLAIVEAEFYRLP